MRCRTVVPIAVLVAGLSVSVHGQREFEIYATLTDASGGPAVGVEPEGLRIVANGEEARVVRVEAIRWPLNVQLLVDNGFGLESQNIRHVRNGARGFFQALPAGAVVTFVTTAPQPRFLVRDTTDSSALFESIGRLVPDSGVGRFLDALSEAANRIGEEQFGAIVALATKVGDSELLNTRAERLLRRLSERAITVHVVQYSAGGRLSVAGGANQTEIGLLVTRATRGRFEGINSASRLASLLPEIGEQIAKSYLDGRFRIIAERPPGASGALDEIQLGTQGGLTVTGLSFDARLP